MITPQKLLWNLREAINGSENGGEQRSFRLTLAGLKIKQIIWKQRDC